MSKLSKKAARAAAKKAPAKPQDIVKDGITLVTVIDTPAAPPVETPAPVSILDAIVADSAPEPAPEPAPVLTLEEQLAAAKAENERLKAEAAAKPSHPKNVTVDAARSAACKRAWETIRANRAAKAAGLPVPEPKKKAAPATNYSPAIAKWLGLPGAVEAAPEVTPEPEPEKVTPISQPGKKPPVHLDNGQGPLCGVASEIATSTTEYSKTTCKGCKTAANKLAAAQTA